VLVQVIPSPWSDQGVGPPPKSSILVKPSGRMVGDGRLLLVNANRALLFDTSMPLWRYCLLAFPIAIVPSLALSVFAYATLRALGVGVAHLKGPEVHATVLDAFGLVVFSPIIETLLLAGGLHILSYFSNRRTPVAAASAIAWGCLHALVGAIWFFGTVWSFFIFSCAYLAWRERGFAQAYTAAAVPHLLINFSVFVAVTLGDQG